VAAAPPEGDAPPLPPPAPPGAALLPPEPGPAVPALPPLPSEPALDAFDEQPVAVITPTAIRAAENGTLRPRCVFILGVRVSARLPTSPNHAELERYHGAAIGNLTRAVGLPAFEQVVMGLSRSSPEPGSGFVQGLRKTL
jgi:hypothetical protein